MNKAEHSLRFRRFQQSRENFFAPKINAELYKQYQTVTRFAETFGVNAVNMIDSGGIQRVIRNLYMDAGIVYGAKIRADFAKMGAYRPQKQSKARGAIGFSHHMAELIAAYFKTDILNTSEGITQTTRDLITKVFNDAYRVGLSINDIVEKLKNTELSKIRARLIARTETVTATNRSALFVAQDTGLLLNKSWLATKDARTRDDHREVDGHQVGRDEYFKVGDATMLVPGARTQENGQPVPAELVVNCRCTTTFSAVRDSAGRLIRA